MCEINWQIVLEFFKLIFSWPTTTLIITIVLVINFKPVISSWIDKFTDSEFELLGQKIKITTQQLSTPIEQGLEATEIAKAAEKSEVSTGNKIYNIPDEIKHIPNVQALVAYVDENPVEAIVDLNRAVKKYLFERAFCSIFGTQVKLIEYLDSTSCQWINVSHIAGFHIAHKQSIPKTSIDLDLHPYLIYLQENGLIELVWTEAAQTIRSTPLAKEFLNYIKSAYPSTWNQKAY
jgi:hypothetical protein